jgi:hypothetical protein
MTLVAAFSPFGCPLMLGDLLITGHPHVRTTVMLPTIGHCHLVDDSVVDLSRVAWLASKVCIINDSLAVGWAGNYESARRIISAMRAFPWRSDITLQEIQQCLATTDYDDQSAVSLVGLFVHGESIGEFGLNAEKFDLLLFSRSRVIGSGSTFFLQAAQDMVGLNQYQRNMSDRPWAEALGIALMTCGGFIGDEIANLGGLDKGYGGLFEIAYLHERRFTKLDDILYCFWRVDEYSKNYISFSPLATFIKLQYHKDILIIRRSNFADRKQMQNDDFIVGPMARQVDLRKLGNIREPDLNSVHDCHVVSVRGGAGHDFLVLVNLFGRDSMVRFEKHGDRIVSFAVNGELLKHIHKRVVERFYQDSI